MTAENTIETDDDPPIEILEQKEPKPKPEPRKAPTSEALERVADMLITDKLKIGSKVTIERTASLALATETTPFGEKSTEPHDVSYDASGYFCGMFRNGAGNVHILLSKTSPFDTVFGDYSLEQIGVLELDKDGEDITTDFRITVD